MLGSILQCLYKASVSQIGRGAVLPLNTAFSLELRSRQLPPMTPPTPSPMVQPANNSSSPGGAVHPPALRQRDPPTLSGLEQDDIEDWLDAFEHVSRHN